MPSKPRMRLSVLRIVVLAVVLALVPAKPQPYETSFGDTPALIVSVAQVQFANGRPALTQRFTLCGLEPVEMVGSAPQQRSKQTLFARVFRRFVTECSWLC